MFSKIDLQSGHWQMPVKLGDVHKTTFKMRWGLYEFLVVPFGVTNDPAQFMNMMNALLGECLTNSSWFSLMMSLFTLPTQKTMLNT